MNKLFTKACYIATLAMVLNVSASYAQVVITESFDFAPTGVVWPNTNLPFGWTQKKISAGVDANNFWERINNTALNPTCTPRTGVGMMRFKSDLMIAGSQSGLISRRFDLRGNVAGTTVSFWMYRDNGPLGNDNIQIAINTVPDELGATFLNAPSPAVVNRPCGSAPAVACLPSYNAANWYQYTYNIPNTWNTANNYIIIVGTAFGGGENIYIDDFSITTYPNAQTYTTSAFHFQNTANVGQNSTNNMIMGLKVTVDGEATPVFLDSILLNTNGSTNPNFDITANSAKLWYTGGTSQFTLLNSIQYGPGVSTAATNMGFKIQLAATAGAFPGNTVTFASTAGLQIGMLVRGTGIAANATITALTPTVATLSLANTALPAGTIRFAPVLTHGDNYFWLTYDIAPNPTSTPGNCLDAEFLNTGINNTLYTPAPQTIAGCREIDVVYCGGVTPFYSVGTSWLNGSYTNNDYVQGVILNGLLGYPNINNTVPNNNFGPPIAPYFGGVAPFSNHPPDYELFPTTMPGKTTTLQIADGGTCNLTAGSNTIFFPGGVPSLTAIGQPISVPGYINWTGLPFLITGFTANTITYAGTAPAVTISGVTAWVGNAYNIQLQVGTWFSSNYIAAWIDFFKNGTFVNTLSQTTPGGEKISQSGSLSTSQWYTSYFQVPPTATLGRNTLRVREIYATSNCDPCASATYGETEDYGIDIIGFCGVPGWKTWLGITDDWNSPSNWCPAGVPTPVWNVRIPASVTPGYTRPIIKAGIAAVCNRLRIEGADTLYIDAYQNGSLTCGDSISILNAQGMLKVISSFNATAVMGVGTLYNASNTPLKGAFRSQRMQITYTQAELLARGMLAGDVITQVKIPVAALGATGTHTFNNLNINWFYTNSFWCFPGANPTLAPVVTPGGTAYTGNPLIVLGDNTITLTTPITWSGSINNLVIEICYQLPAGVATERVEQTQTLGCRSMAYWGDLSGATPGCALTGLLTPRGSSDQRPNLKLVFDRPYKKVPITLAGHWGNNGTFVPGFSRVIFNGINAQNIAGTTNTNFYDLHINNTNVLGVAQVTAATLIGDSLVLTNGPFRLNGLTFTHNNNLPTSVSRTNGWLQSESTGPYGSFLWKMGTNLSPHVFPFGLGAGAANYLPFTFTPTAGAGIEATIATYNTVPANTPFPVGVPAIQNFYTGADNSPNMVDRFWQIDLAGTGTTGNYLFSYRSAEIAANGNTNPRAQRWQTGPSKWTDPSTFAVQSNPSANQVLVPAQNTSGSWAISIQAQPLPVELLSFTAKKEKDRVKLLWSTASELSNDYFTVERTQNQNEFSFIDKVDSRGPSSSILDYYTYDYRPLNGLQYYRLKQTDFDGTETFSKLVPVSFGKQSFEIVTVAKDISTQSILFNYDSDGQVSIRLVDIMGKTVFEQLNVKAIDGINQFDLTSNVTKGIYTLFIYDNSRMVSRKIIF